MLRQYTFLEAMQLLKNNPEAHLFATSCQCHQINQNEQFCWVVSRRKDAYLMPWSYSPQKKEYTAIAEENYPFSVDDLDLPWYVIDASYLQHLAQSQLPPTKH